MYTALHNIIYIYVMQKHMQTTKISKRTTLYSRNKYVNYLCIYISISVKTHGCRALCAGRLRRSQPKPPSIWGIAPTPQ